MNKKTQVTPFQFHTHQVRVVCDEQGSPWFVAKDVCDALEHTNSRKALADHVDDEDKGVTVGYTPGGEQKLKTINESGLYALIFGSRLEGAKSFKRWVTSEVLPAIRRTGGYQTGQTIDAETLAELKGLYKSMSAQIDALRQELRVSHKLALAGNPTWERLIHYYGKGLSTTDCAKLVDISPRTARRHVALLKSAGLIGPVQGELGELLNTNFLPPLPADDDKPVH